MLHTKEPFIVRWRSLSDPQRRFLLAAYELDRQLPHEQGLDVVWPKLGWRAVGMECGMTPAESDDVVRTLSTLGFISVPNAEEQKFCLSSASGIKELLNPERRLRKLWREWGLPLISTLLAAAAYFLFSS